MSLNLIYSFKEGILGLRRARLATVLTVSIISVALSLLGFFLIITVNIGQMVRIFRNRVTFEVYIDRENHFAED